MFGEEVSATSNKQIRKACGIKVDNEVSIWQGAIEPFKTFKDTYDLKTPQDKLPQLGETNKMTDLDKQSIDKMHQDMETELKKDFNGK